MKKVIILLVILLLATLLRFYRLDKNPPSPYWEEAALGYDAYSILKTGRDFHGNPFPIVAFESFGDWKPSLYFYATVPSIAFFGLNTFAIRSPSAFFGTLTVLLTFLLVRELIRKATSHQPPATSQLPTLSAALLAISPWHLQVSRIGFEANLGLFLVVLGFWLFLLGINKKPFYFALCSLLFALSLYTYHANRIFIPLLGLTLGLFFFKKLLKKKKWAILAAILFLAGSLPIFLSLKSPQISKRFAETSAFSTLDPILKSNRLIEEDGGGRLAKIIHHRFWHYADIFIKNYMSHFNFDFLFLNGDINPRHSVQLVGNLYLIQLPFLILGIYFLFSKKNWPLLPILFWLFLAPIPASLTKAIPHTLRSLPMVIPLTILSSYGLLQLIKVIKKQKLLLHCFIVSLFFVLLVEFSRYLFIYHKDYSIDYSRHFQYGYKQMIGYVFQNKDKYEKIYITRKLGRPSIYYWFYTKTDPYKVQILNDKVKKDQGEYLQFQNILFNLPDLENVQKPALVVTGEDEEFRGEILKEINYLDGKMAFRVYEVN